MTTGEQETVNLDQFVDYIRQGSKR
jgi:hypothetical protein